MKQVETFNIEILGNEIQTIISKNFEKDLDNKEAHLIKLDDYIKNHKSKKSIKKILEDWIDELNNLSNENGPNSFNFYPSTRFGSCCSVCIGVATKKFGHNRDQDKPRTGFKGLIKEIIGQWLSCSNTNDTIIVTVDWDEEVFEKEWKPIIDRYTSNQNKNVKIYYFLANQVGYYLQQYPRP
jgi:hypothetical protein